MCKIDWEEDVPEKVHFFFIICVGFIPCVEVT